MKKNENELICESVTLICIIRDLGDGRISLPLPLLPC